MKVQKIKKKDQTAKIRNRGDVIFPAESKSVKDDKDHFPINNVKQARNALARASQYNSSPSWYNGSLEMLVKKVASEVHKKYPSIKVSKAGKTLGKANESLNEVFEKNKRPIKSFGDVEIGDIAYESPWAGGYWDHPEGEIIWKGTADELRNSIYYSMAEDWGEEDMEEWLDDYDWVVVNTGSPYGDILFNYNCDPSGVVTYAD